MAIGRNLLVRRAGEIKDGTTIWHVCTNVIESLFSLLKEKLPTNPLNGISGIVLSLCLRTGQGMDFDIQQALEQISIADLNNAKSIYLTKNQVIKRGKILKT